MINIRFSPLAFIKIQTLVNGYDKEVGWYGTTEKVADHDFRIIDIMVPPQYTSAAYISDCKDDPLEFQKWLDTLDDDTYNAKRFHGHSHVNMSVGPSGTDDEFFKAFSHTNSMATINSYTIDLIINKKMDMHWWVMDEDGTEYKNKDIEWTVEVQPGVTIDEFFDSTRELVRDIYKSSQFLWGSSTGFKTAGSSYVKTKADREAEKNKPKVVVTTKNDKKAGNKSGKSAKTSSECYYPWDAYYGYDDYYGGYYGGYSNPLYSTLYDDEEEEELKDSAFMIFFDKDIRVTEIGDVTMVIDKDEYYHAYDDVGDVYFFDIEKIENTDPKSVGRQLYEATHLHDEAKDPEVTFFIEGDTNTMYWEILGGLEKIEALEDMLNETTDKIQTDTYKSGKFERTEITFTIEADEKEEDE